MKKKLLIGIVIFVAIISIAVFCYVKFVSNSNDDKTSETVSQASDDNFIDIDLARQLHNQLNLGKKFTAVGFAKERDDSNSMYYIYGEDTSVSIVFKDNKVNCFNVSINCLDYKFDRKEFLDCVEKLLSKNWFNFSKKEKEEILSIILDDDVSKTINDVEIHTFGISNDFWVNFQLD